MFMVLLSKSTFPPIQLMLMGIKITSLYIMKQTSSTQDLQWLLSALAEDKWSRKAAGKTGWRNKQHEEPPFQKGSCMDPSKHKACGTGRKNQAWSQNQTKEDMMHLFIGLQNTQIKTLYILQCSTITCHYYCVR